MLDHDRPVLCDIDGVLRHWPSTDDLHRANGLAPGTIETIVAQTRPFAVAGRINDSGWRKKIVALMVEHGVTRMTAESAVADWSATVPVLDRGVLDVLTTWRHRVCLVTNSTDRLGWEIMTHTPELDEFIIVNSYWFGVAKPHPGIYHAAAAIMATTTPHCLYVDDSDTHIRGAHQAGVTRSLHWTAKSTAQDLDQWIAGGTDSMSRS